MLCNSQSNSSINPADASPPAVQWRQRDLGIMNLRKSERYAVRYLDTVTKLARTNSLRRLSRLHNTLKIRKYEKFQITEDEIRNEKKQKKNTSHDLCNLANLALAAPRIHRPNANRRWLTTLSSFILLQSCIEIDAEEE